MARKVIKSEPVVEVVEEVPTGGLGIDEGIVLATFLILIAAVVMVWVASQHYSAA